MIPEDYNIYETSFPVWKHYIDHNTVLLLSPNVEQRELIKKIFSESQIYVSTRDDWDLNQSNADKFDLIIAMNVLMYSPKPALWLKNIMGSCKTFWIQDITYRVRGRNGRQLGYDGDATRYHYGTSFPAMADGSYDLGSYSVNRYIPYSDHKGSKHFLAELIND